MHRIADSKRYSRCHKLILEQRVELLALKEIPGFVPTPALNDFEDFVVYNISFMLNSLRVSQRRIAEIQAHQPFVELLKTERRSRFQAMTVKLLESGYRIDDNVTLRAIIGDVQIEDVRVSHQ
jgi:hypothetical protein